MCKLYAVERSGGSPLGKSTAKQGNLLRIRKCYFPILSYRKMFIKITEKTLILLEEMIILNKNQAFKTLSKK